MAVVKGANLQLFQGALHFLRGVSSDVSAPFLENSSFLTLRKRTKHIYPIARGEEHPLNSLCRKKELE